MNVEKIKTELLRRINDQHDPSCGNALSGLLTWISITEGTTDDLMDDAAILQDYGQIGRPILEGINRHALLHEPKGDFITAVLTNNLRESFARADHLNQKVLFQICSYCHNEIPGVCWGSPEKVKAWIETPRSEWHPGWRNITAPENTKEIQRQDREGIWGLTKFREGQ